MDEILLYLFVIILVSMFVLVGRKVLKQCMSYSLLRPKIPVKPLPTYPYFTYNFDISGKRNPRIECLLDNFLISSGWQKIGEHKLRIERWKQEVQQLIWQNIRDDLNEQWYNQVLDDDNAYVFNFVRLQTVYKQSNGVRTAHRVEVVTDSFRYSYKDLEQRYHQLKSDGFEIVTQEQFVKEQRRLMTRELREKIMVRDKYTCQLCGKQMLDEVGLQIDHIIPVTRGGKTVDWNLQVLCSKCNGSKSNKTLN